MHHKNLSMELIREVIDGVEYVEEFRPIVGAEGFYEISSFGRVKRLGRPYKSRSKSMRPARIILATTSGKKKRYPKVSLRIDMKSRVFTIHRLVALHFIPLVPGKEHVNHKTGEKLKNHYTQLEWCTPQENNEHAFQMGLLKRGRKPPKPYVKKGYLVGKKQIVNLKTGELFAHVTELSKKTGKSIKTLRRSLSGERYNHTAFRYVGEEDVFKVPLQKPPKLEMPIPVAKFDTNWNMIEHDDLKKMDAKIKQKVSAFLNGNISSVDGFYYKRIDEKGSYVDLEVFKRKVRQPSLIPVTPSKALLKFDLNGIEVARFDSIRDAAQSIGADRSNFKKLLKKGRKGYYKGFIWKFAEPAGNTG